MAAEMVNDEIVAASIIILHRAFLSFLLCFFLDSCLVLSIIDQIIGKMTGSLPNF